MQSIDPKNLLEMSKTWLNREVEVDEISLLRDALRYHEHKYYVENDPVISDYEYDILYKKLEKLEHLHPELITPESPTQRVGSDLITEFRTIKHITPMLSLENSYNAEDLKNFEKQILKLTGGKDMHLIEYTVEPKYDGGSVALVYENDILVRAATRGNGFEGEDITANMRTLKTVPLRANFSEFGIQKAEIRGEALIRKSKFKEINQDRLKNGLSLFANPRNAATGGLRTKNPNETAKRGIELMAFQLGYAADADGNDVLKKLAGHFEALELLKNLGFKVPGDEKKKCSNIQEVIQFCQENELNRDSHEYELDGMVVKLNDFSLQQLCGNTAHHPRWAIAFKFKAKQATTKLLNIEYQVGKVGSITPVAKLEPVYLAGVTVSSVSLHNEEFITSRDLRIGDMVLVERAGDVIPYIVKCLPEMRDGSEKPFRFPTHCPVNSDTSNPVPLTKKHGESVWRCENCICGAQDLQRIIFHVSKDAMDIDGLGKSQVEKFYELGWLKDISDVYNLDYNLIAQLEGFGEKSVQNLKNSIDKAKKNPIHKLLHSLSIHHLGNKASKLIAERIRHVLDLTKWNLEDFTQIKDIGPVVAENTIKWFSNEKNIAMLQRMETYGVNLFQTEEDKPLESSELGLLSGKTILFTGTLERLGRKEAEQLAASMGAKVLSAVSSNLNILVVGSAAGSKLAKAQKLGTVEIWDENKFLELVNG